MIYFEKDKNTAIIGTYSFFKADEYDAMDPTQMPVPTEVLRLDDVVIGFNGLQDMPFEESTGLVPVIEEYQMCIRDSYKPAQAVCLQAQMTLKFFLQVFSVIFHQQHYAFHQAFYCCPLEYI